MSYVNSVSEFKQDRIIAEVDAGLKDQVAAISGEKSKDGKRYIGPEDSGIEHGIFDVSFRENIKEGAQQLSFASSLKFEELILILTTAILMQEEGFDTRAK
ncbi:MAG: hypothetical protein U0X75_04055 [Acidobacteriota bacterium]